MGLTAYIWQLTLGAHSRQPSPLADPAQDPSEAAELDRAKRDEDAIIQSETDILTRIGFFNTPNEDKDAAENLAGFGLAITALASNYGLSFPFLVARYRNQVFPFLFRDKDGSPLTYFRYLNGIRVKEGVSALYPGLGIGLLAQIAVTRYEDALSSLMQQLSPHVRKHGWTFRIIANIIFKGFELALYVPLYPLYRNAILLSIQCDTPFTKKRIITLRDIVISYKRDLVGLFYRSSSGHTTLPWTSTFLPSCILHFLTEITLNAAYSLCHSQLVSKSNTKDQSVVATAATATAAAAAASSSSLPPSPTTPTTPTLPATPINPQKPKQHHCDLEPMLQTFYADIVCNFASNLLTKIVILPLETVVLRLMVQGSGILVSDTDYTGMWDCVKRMYAEDGINAFYTGFWGGWLSELIVAWVVLEATWGLYKGVRWGIEWWYDDGY